MSELEARRVRTALKRCNHCAGLPASARSDPNNWQEHSGKQRAIPCQQSERKIQVFKTKLVITTQKTLLSS